MIDGNYTPIGELWGLHDEFTVQEAAMLMIGVDPSDPNWDDSICQYDNAHRMVDVAMKAIKKAVESGKLKASIRYPIQWVENNSWGITEEVLATTWPNTRYMLTGEDRSPEEDRHCIVVLKAPDWSKTTIDRDDLRDWLRSRGVTDGFFFSEDKRKGEPAYLDPTHPHYAPKLAALVRAWCHVNGNPGYKQGKSTKQKIEAWLREHAAEFGQTDDEGRPTTAFIDSAPIANWDTKGGAPTTPSGPSPQVKAL